MSGERAMHHGNDDSYLTDDLEQSLLESPAKKPSGRDAPSHSRQTSTQQTGRSGTMSREQHEENLRQELASVRKVNEAIEGVVESLEKARNNMKNVNQTVSNASTLLNIWTRILSQTEHNQRLILDPAWQGASNDITDLEEEAQAKQQDADRRAAEEQERRAAIAAKKAEEEERRLAENLNATKPKPSIRGRGGGLTRGSSTGRAGYVTAGGSTASSSTGTTRGTTSSRRTTTGTGRTTSSRYARGRG